jgi:hypothetical protein
MRLDRPFVAEWSCRFTAIFPVSLGDFTEAAARGITNERGKPFSAASTASMLAARRPIASISAPT